MTELEKLLNHIFYNSDTDELRSCCDQVKELLYEYNHLPPSRREEGEQILRRVFGSAGKGLWIEAPFQCDIGKTTHVGDNFYVNHNCVFLDAGGLTVGDNVRIGPNTGIYTPQHAYDPELRAAGYEISWPVVIEDNVWIGGSVSILGGVTIGKNSIIGAGSVVTKDIPPNVVAAGNPCRVIHELTEEHRMAHSPQL